MMRRFCAYVDKVFDLGQQLHQLRDARKQPRIPTGAIWGSLLFVFILRQRSLNAMAQHLAPPKRLEPLIGKVKPSPDRMGDVAALIPPDQLRQMLSRINHQLRRNKALRNGWPLRVGALDGHEFFSQSAPVLSPVFDANLNHEERGRSDRVFSSRRGLSFGGISEGPASGSGDDPTGRRGGDRGQTALRTHFAPVWTLL